MKSRLLILILSVYSFTAFSQGYRFTLGSSNVYFENFSDRKIIFNGFNAEYTFLFNRLGLSLEVGYYFPKAYYGQVVAINYNTTPENYHIIPVYIKGSSLLWGMGLTFDIIHRKSQRFKLYAYGGLSNFAHYGKYDEDPFIRLYGQDNISADNVGEIVFGTSGPDIGLGCVFKVGNCPVHITIKRTVQITTYGLEISGYFEGSIGIGFPILKSPPPTEIIKLTY
jgi:hypothetical protein